MVRRQETRNVVPRAAAFRAGGLMRLAGAGRAAALGCAVAGAEVQAVTEQRGFLAQFPPRVEPDLCARGTHGGVFNGSANP